MNEIPLSLFILMSGIAILFFVISVLITENFTRIITSILSMGLSFVNAQLSINGNLVEIQPDNSYIIVTVPYLNYIWLLISLISLILIISFIIDEVHINTQYVLSKTEHEDNEE